MQSKITKTIRLVIFFVIVILCIAIEKIWLILVVYLIYGFYCHRIWLKNYFEQWWLQMKAAYNGGKKE